MRYLFLSLSAVLCIGLFSCGKGESGSRIREMSARIKRASSDTGGVWIAEPDLVKYSNPFTGSILFTGSDYATLNTNLNIFIRDFDAQQGKSYPLYQGTAQQTDSNYARLTFQGREFHTISGEIDVLRNDDVYIANFSFVARSLDDTIRVTNGHLTMTK
jgi:hypothetical protein